MLPASPESRELGTRHRLLDAPRTYARRLRECVGEAAVLIALAVAGAVVVAASNENIEDFKDYLKVAGSLVIATIVTHSLFPPSKRQ